MITVYGVAPDAIDVEARIAAFELGTTPQAARRWLDQQRAQRERPAPASPHRTSRATRPSPAQRPHSAPQRPSAPERPSLVLVELKGWALGRQYDHDPGRLARALGLEVVTCSDVSLQDSSRPDTWVRGQHLIGSGVIQLSDALNGRERLETLSHELAHAIWANADELQADMFSRCFLHRDASEAPGAGWAAVQERLLQRARQDAAAAARARR
jgi:hypothetical protein